MLSSIAVGLLFGVVGTAATVGTGAGVLALMGKPTYLTDPIVMRSAAGLLSSWLGFVVLLGYAIAFALIGRLTTLRHDIT